MSTKQRTTETHISFSQKTPTDVLQNIRNPYKLDFLFVGDDFEEGIESCTGGTNALFRALQKSGYKKTAHTFNKCENNPELVQHKYLFEKDTQKIGFTLTVNPKFIKISTK